MIVERVINNNVISTLDNGVEVVISGKGIGFGKRVGDPVDETRIEKIFRMENRERLGKFQDLLVKVPLECLKISDAIITKAKEELDQELNENIYITLTDHITFAIERYDKGLDFENALTQEVCSFYPREFKIGLEAVKLIEDTTGKNLKEDEAASIALHLVSAEMSTRTSIAFEITRSVKALLSIIHAEVNPDGLWADSKVDDLVPTLKHLVFRVIMDKQYAKDDITLYTYVKNRYPKESHCCDAISDYLEKQFRKKVTIDEKTYCIILLRKNDF